MFFNRRPVNVFIPPPEHTTVIRKVPAPVSATDSARLLWELQAQAQANIIESVKISNNHIECVVHIERSFQDRSVAFKAILDVNGKRLTVDHTEPEKPEFRQSRNDGLIALRDKIAAAIATEVLSDAIRLKVE